MSCCQVCVQEPQFSGSGLLSEHFGRLIAIGDIHGCVHALDVLLGEIEPKSSDRLVFLGDLIDQGRDSGAVLDRLIQLQQQCDVVLIKGNHEEMILAARESESALRDWENCGGGTYGTKEFRNPRPWICHLHRYRLLAPRVVDCVGLSFSCDLTSEPMGFAARS